MRIKKKHFRPILYRKNLKHGDILHCSGESFIQRMIKFFTRSQIAHTAMVVELNGIPYIIDAQHNGVNLKTVESWNERYNYSYTLHRYIDPTPAWNEEVLKRAMSKVGVTGYDFLDGFFAQAWYIITGKWRGKREADAEGRMYCSEFVGWVYNMPRWWKLSPEAVYRILQENRKWKKII